MDTEQAQKLCMDAVAIISRDCTDEECRKAADMFRQVADAGYSQGMFGLADMKMAGRGIPLDVKGAIDLYEAAAGLGNVPAIFRLGTVFWAQGDNYQPERSFQCFVQSAEAGFPPAYNCLGDCYFHGIGTPKDESKAVEWYVKAASNGDADASFKLGCIYEEGMGVPKDDSLSLKMFMQAAMAGVPEAQFRVGSLAYEGKIEGGKKGAAKWFGLCEDTIPIAKFNLATMYYSGDGVEKDLKRAFGMYMQLGEAGDPDALFQIGKMYIGGEGVELDPQKGFEYIAKAANAGNQEALLLIESLRRRQNTQLIHIDGAE